jgi:hypothetical protein
LLLAQAPGTFTFWNTGATLSYDDYLVITYNSGGIVAGYEDLSIFGDANAPSLVSSLPPVKMASQLTARALSSATASMTPQKMSTPAISGRYGYLISATSSQRLTPPARTPGWASAAATLAPTSVTTMAI